MGDLKGISTEDLVAIQNIIDREIKSREEENNSKLAAIIAADIKKVLRSGYVVTIANSLSGDDVSMFPDIADDVVVRVDKF